MYSSEVAGQRRVARAAGWLSLAAIVLAGSPPGTGLARSDDLQPYARRIEHLDDWGRWYPGYRSDAGGPLSDLGVVAAIRAFTVWQQESGRHRLPIWSRLNAAVSIQPYLLALEHRRDGLECVHGAFVSAHPTRQDADAPLTRQDVCRAWRTYFVASDAIRDGGLDEHPVARSIAQRCFWDAHTKSLVHELWQQGDQLRTETLPEGERRFWVNSIRLTMTLADNDYPTTDTNAPFFSSWLPECSPLGEGACHLASLSGARFVLVGFLTAQERSVESLIDDYVVRRDRGDPPCTDGVGALPQPP